MLSGEINVGVGKEVMDGFVDGRTGRIASPVVVPSMRWFVRSN